MATWRSRRVSEVITDVEEEKFVLPVIQRRLVWEEEKMERLFDTLLKGDSFGGIMVIEEESDSQPLFTFRPFTKDGEPIPSRQVTKLPHLQWFVIDGQQRLQSFYIGLKGSINGKVLYFDLFSDHNSEFEFKFANSLAQLPKASKENPDRPIREHFWYLASSLLKELKRTHDEDPVVNKIIAAHNITSEDAKNHVTKNVKAFLKNVLNTETLGLSTVYINAALGETVNKQRIVELFRRLNDGGTRLSPFDLVASMLKGFDWQMEGFLDEILNTYGEIGLNQDNLIKLIFILQDDHKKEMTSISSADAKFAIDNKARIQNTLKAVRDFLFNAKLLDYYKDGSRSFIPLFFISYHLFHKAITNDALNAFFHNYDSGNSEFPRFKNWIFHSLLNGVFKSKGVGWIPYKTGIRKLLEAVSAYKGKEFPVDELFSVYSNHPLPTFTTKYNATHLDILDSSFAYYLIYDKKEAIRLQDIDHIMPRSRLESLGYDAAKINTIGNFQLIDYQTNRGAKNDKSFGEWINDHECVKDKAAFVRKHLIPADETLWDEKRFEEFLACRVEMILRKLADALPVLG